MGPLPLGYKDSVTKKLDIALIKSELFCQYLSLMLTKIVEKWWFLKIWGLNILRNNSFSPYFLRD